MPNTYVDRGIVKWNAFDALTGYHSMLEEMKYRLGKKEKPSLSDDALDELNMKLQSALMQNEEIELRYFHDGYIRFTFGKIKKVDYTSKEIVLSTLERFRAEDIIDIFPA
ncbi:MAG: YolD-like family protein [Firmicutes bacterium]|nr:YolD-like family protein [Bacillota bacterium]